MQKDGHKAVQPAAASSGLQAQRLPSWHSAQLPALPVAACMMSKAIEVYDYTADQRLAK
jgi:hypothetical protein